MRMSKCVVHMKKMKMSAMGGIQSHNQREHESSKNKEIDYSKSEQNYDVLLDERINYQRAIKERIAELNLKRAVRSDAVVYSSFIVSSDRGFFYNLGYHEHIRKSNESESVAIGLTPITDFDYCDEEYKNQCIADGSRRFFENATKFFCDRYGRENVINATVHMDEHTPHMHIGIVPITPDGRLSAKQLFTKQSLRELQTDFAETVGKEFGLERGTEGSKAKHLDEVTYKLAKREEQLDETQIQLDEAEISLHLKTEEFLDLSDELERGKSELLVLEGYKSTLERQIEPLKGKIEALENKLENLQTDQKLLMEEFVQSPAVKAAFNNYCLTARRRQQQERAERENVRKMSLSYWREYMEQNYSSSERNKNDTLRNNEYER